MDYSALLNALLTDDNVKEISKESHTTPAEVKKVVNAAIPLFEENGAQAAETKLTRAAANGTNRSILGTLLGAGASAAISQNSGVSNKKTSSILSIIAPLLLSSMLGTSSNAGSNSGLTSLLGGLLGLGQTQQTQTVQQNNTAGTLSLLSSLLGAGMSSQQQTVQVQQQQTVNLFGNQQPVQTQTYANNTGRREPSVQPSRHGEHAAGPGAAADRAGPAAPDRQPLRQPAADRADPADCPGRRPHGSSDGPHLHGHLRQLIFPPEMKRPRRPFRAPRPFFIVCYCLS